MDTIYSLSGAVPAGGSSADLGDEAGDLQRGALVVGSAREYCLIRRIGPDGAVLHASAEVMPGARLALEVDGGIPLEGEVAWRRGAEIGLTFDEPIDILPILARHLAAQPDDRRRMPRVEVHCPARIEAAAGEALVTVRDLSGVGARIAAPFALEPGAPIALLIEGLPRVEGEVRWARDKEAGIAFDPELGWAVLMPWLRARAAARAAAREQDGALAEAGGAPADSVPLKLPARVREGNRRCTIEVTGLTTRTVEFDCYSALQLGTMLWIVLPGLEGWPARIVGIEGYRVTAEFTQRLHPAVLERIVALAKAPAGRA